MPMHDWTRVDAGLYHAFHHGWIEELARALNRGVLPANFFALPEQNIRGPIPDVLALRHTGSDQAGPTSGGVAVADRPPRTRFTHRTETDAYARKASHIAVRHRHGQIVAVIEIVSPGNKASAGEFRALVDKSVKLIRQGVHVLLIDPFPPGKRDPAGLHPLIWEEFRDESFELPPDKNLTLVSYEAGPELVAYLECVAVGDCLPDMPLFLEPGTYVPVPLEAAYQAAWAEFPAALKGLLGP